MPVAREVDGVVAQFKGEAAVEQEMVAHFEGGFEAGVFFGISPCHYWEKWVGGRGGLVNETVQLVHGPFQTLLIALPLVVVQAVADQVRANQVSEDDFAGTPHGARF